MMQTATIAAVGALFAAALVYTLLRQRMHHLARAFGELSERVGRQVAELQRHETQRRELLANVSHDLRTPLTLMQGYLQTMLLRHGDMSRAEERSCLEVATRHAERLGALVADLFDFATLEGSAQGLQRERLSITELVQDTAQKFAFHAAGRGVCIECRLPDDVAMVDGNIGLLERALQNLVDNALRHTPQGGRVTLAVATSERRAFLSVSDTGVGIAPESLPRVFERYFQAPRVEGLKSGRPGTGAGLGLAITQRIVALHGSEIHVASTVGVGTVFSFELPLAGEDRR